MPKSTVHVASSKEAEGGTSHHIRAGFHRPSFSLSKDIGAAHLSNLNESRTERQNALNNINQQIGGARPKSVQRERPIPKSRLHEDQDVAKSHEGARDEAQGQGTQGG